MKQGAVVVKGNEERGVSIEEGIDIGGCHDILLGDDWMRENKRGR